MKKIGFESLLVEGDFGWHDGSGEISYSFMTEVPDYYKKVDTNGDGDVDSHKILGGDRLEFGADVTMRAIEKELSNLAIDAWNEVGNVNLVAADGDDIGDITFASADFGRNGGYGFITKFPDGTIGEPDRRGDVWINNGLGVQDKSIYGHTSWNTYLHELGHALGLSHPDDDPNNFANSPDNSNKFTVMSYVAHDSEVNESLNKGAWPLTPMLYDIAAIQEIYGANMTTRVTDTTYFGDAGAGELAFQYGADDMKVNGRDVILTIWDAGGTDLIDASDLRTAVEIDLRPGKFSTIGDEKDNVALAYAVKEDGVVVNYIENAIGSSKGDVIGGNGDENTLKGKTGADKLSGLNGDDALQGGRGRDVLNGGRGDDDLSGGRGADTFVFNGKQDQGEDTISDFRDGSDEIRIKGLSFSDLDIVREGDEVRITLDGKTEIVLLDTDVGDITRSDFDFV